MDPNTVNELKNIRDRLDNLINSGGSVDTNQESLRRDGDYSTPNDNY